MMIEKISTYRFRNYLSAKVLADEFAENQFFCQLERDGNQTLLHVFVEAETNNQPRTFVSIIKEQLSNHFLGAGSQHATSV